MYKILFYTLEWIAVKYCMIKIGVYKYNLLNFPDPLNEIWV